jgi:hypothetical protein
MYNIGKIEFECLRHHDGSHSSELLFESGKMKVQCPVCGRMYAINEQNKFYSDRPLKILDIHIDKNNLEHYLKIMNKGK